MVITLSPIVNIFAIITLFLIFINTFCNCYFYYCFLTLDFLLIAIILQHSDPWNEGWMKGKSLLASRVCKFIFILMERPFNYSSMKSLISMFIVSMVLVAILFTISMFNVAAVVISTKEMQTNAFE